MSLSLYCSRRSRGLLAAAALPLVLAACPAPGDADAVPREDLVHACRGYEAALAQLAQIGATITIDPVVRQAAEAACQRVRETGR